MTVHSDVIAELWFRHVFKVRHFLGEKRVFQVQEIADAVENLEIEQFQRHQIGIVSGRRLSKLNQ